MQDRPTAMELVAAVRDFLKQEVLPKLSDSRLRFRTRVAANALAMVEREIREGPAFARQEAERLRELLRAPPFLRDECEECARVFRVELAHRIRSGAADEGAWREAVMEATRSSVREKLLVSNPKFFDPTAKQRAGG
jgi:hypothetical protein